MNTLTATTDPALPPGAEPDIWEDTGYRDVYSAVGCVLASKDILCCPLVTTIARQDQNGKVDRIRVAVEADIDLTATQARELAGHLIEAARIAEQWSAPADGRMSAAKSALAEAKQMILQLYVGLREKPGNAGDYLRAALDCIADAEAVTQ